MESTFPTDMLEYLVCPETHQTLQLADAPLLGKLQAAQQTGNLKNKAGVVVSETFEQALVRQDGQVVYLIRDGIPIMLVEEGVEPGNL